MIRPQAERLIDEAVATLEAAGVASPVADAEWLLVHVLGVPRGTVRRASVQAPQR